VIAERSGYLLREATSADGSSFDHENSSLRFNQVISLAQKYFCERALARSAGFTVTPGIGT